MSLNNIRHKNRKDIRMKTLLFALLILICLPFLSALGQERVDVIYLKNGDIFKGAIIENVPNDYVKIELSGGLVFTVKYIDISKFTKEKPENNLQQLQESRRPESNDQSSSMKMMYYDSEKKSPGTAVVLSLVLTSVGHAYAGNWGRGLLFTAGRVGGVVVALTAGIKTETHQDYLGYGTYYTYETTKITDLYYVGFCTALLFTVWEAVDASVEVDRYNDNLYNKIMGKMPIHLGVVPSRNGPQVQMSYSF